MVASEVYTNDPTILAPDSAQVAQQPGDAVMPTGRVFQRVALAGLSGTKFSMQNVTRAAPFSSAIRNWRDRRRALSSNPRCGADSRPGLPGLPAHAQHQR